ncbi:MAG: hypothetical protein P0Y65_14720 [Candidatus Devosia phytovorans]|uniref:DUF1579 domain-containing protein n=1 Tax=Candidatus Devosia phytovorans TaxID=3121372 RepID=A0AAJ6AZ57_9HYPH|nr:hypothetical protein [Devosia sp.]WEK03441.1 MAG: hypothetical protein P0Y65_14720 [Devosia sp.]
MRFALAAAIAMFSLPAQADVVDQFASARPLFGTTYPAAITSGLDGDWVELMGYARNLGPDAGPARLRSYAEDFLDMTCHSVRSKGKVRVESISDYRFTMQLSPEVAVVTHYDWIEGSPITVNAPRFLRSTHATESEADYRPRQWDGPVTIHRPSQDILVINEPAGTMAIWGRCPVAPYAEEGGE